MSGVPAPPPPPPVGWGPPPFHLAQWLKNIDMVQYQAEFESNGYDRIDALCEMSTPDLESLGIKKGHIKVFESAIKNLQAGNMFPPHRGSFMGPPGVPPMPLPPHRPSLAPMPIAPPPPHTESGDGEGDGAESKEEGKAEGQPAKKKRNRIPGKVSLAKGNMPPMRMVQPINMPRPPPFYPFPMPLPPANAKPITTVDGKPLAPKKVDALMSAEPVKEKKKPGRKKKMVEPPKEEGEEDKEGEDEKEGEEKEEGAEEGGEGEAAAEKPEKKRKKIDDGNAKPPKKQSIAVPPPSMPQFPPYGYPYPGPYPGYPPYPGPPPPGAEGYPYPPYGPPGGMFPPMGWGPHPGSQPPPPGGNPNAYAPRLSIPALPKPMAGNKGPRPIATRPLAVAQAFGIPPVLLEKKEKEGSDVEKPKKTIKKKAPEEKEKEAAEKEARKEARAAAQERKKAERAMRKSDKAKEKAAKVVKAAEYEAEKIDSAPMPVVSEGEGEGEAAKEEHVEEVAPAAEEVKETKKGGKKRSAKPAEGESGEPPAKKGRGGKKAAKKEEDDDDKPLKATAKAETEEPVEEEGTEEPGEDVVCSLCGIGEDDPDLGELDGPHGFDKEKQEIWVHEDCAMWSPEFYIDPDKGEPMGLDKIVNRGKSLRCSHCRQAGATIGCKEPACRRTFHFKCIVPSGGAKREEDYFVYCSEHKESMNNPKEASTGRKSAKSSSKSAAKTSSPAATPAPSKSPAPKRKASAAAPAASPAPRPARKGSLRSADRKPRNTKK